MEDTSDGFKIAEEDMKIRGPGEMLGQRQSGIPDFRVGDVVKDIDIMIEARKAAKEALDVIGNEGLAIIKDKVNTRWKSRIDLVDIS